jgi:hypothetical protein
MKYYISLIRLLKWTGALLVSVAVSMCADYSENPSGEYVAGDFHQHTTYSGGDYSFGYVMEASNKYGLDWWSNSDHGGTRENWGRASGLDLGTSVSWTCAGIKPLGSPQAREDDGFMWRWQSLKYFNFQDVLLWRKIFPGKLILQAFEWNVPGHEHCNVSIISGQFDKGSENCNALAQFEYMFDDDDKDTTGGKPSGWIKSRLTGKEKALEAAAWLQSNYGHQAYAIPSHPDKSGGYSIADFRDLNNKAPDVFFGFDGMPGHQKNTTRGSYDLDEAPFITQVGGKRGATFGGAGIFMSQIGNVWDALLSEGRKWWISASSDFHSDDDFLPGEYQKTYVFVKKIHDPQALIDGLRSGNSFIVTGGLITGLSFKAGGKTMGETMLSRKKKVRLEIKILDSNMPNFNSYSEYTNPALNHIDLIAGKVTGFIPPSNPEYAKGNVSTTRVIARFDATGGTRDGNGIVSRKWTRKADGWISVVFDAMVDGSMYFRLRGTNHALNTPGELDGNGNPLPDFAGENNAARAFSDLWFYSNPVFVEAATK